ncbi:hypothetical protein GCM10027598_80960 [Amycolatopsis oliviviridis]|uniref:Uncharacterized protein n=1 Tax=Amycolatopsis oliviviridis TaxID=1471590 RepID=A0ABQ3L5X1_9PSEU|nr:hypothetical protein [Amycolatopsis oliviviridis]GHH06057.1 hypothetical protein GCM10017790_10850 [Amycolatopsis oliviviridis]
MFANWIQIAELALLPLGLGIGYAAGKTCGQEERASFGGEVTITHPGLVAEYQDPAPDAGATWGSAR